MADSIKEIASRLKRQTRNAEILALCDYVLEGGAQRWATGPENRATVMNREGSTPSPSATLGPVNCRAFFFARGV